MPILDREGGYYQKPCSNTSPKTDTCFIRINFFFSGTAGDSLGYHRGRHFPPKIVIMTIMAATVPQVVKVPGGTTVATIPT